MDIYYIKAAKHFSHLLKNRTKYIEYQRQIEVPKPKCLSLTIETVEILVIKLHNKSIHCIQVACQSALCYLGCLLDFPSKLRCLMQCKYLRILVGCGVVYISLVQN